MAAAAALDALFAPPASQVAVVVKRRRLAVPLGSGPAPAGERTQPGADDGRATSRAPRVFVLDAPRPQPADDPARTQAPAERPLAVRKRRRSVVRKPGAVVHIAVQPAVQAPSAAPWQPPADGPVQAFWALPVGASEYADVMSSLHALERLAAEAAAASEVLRPTA